MIYLSSGEPNRLERSRDRSYSVFVYLGVEEQKVNCVFFIVYRTCMCVELVRFRVEHNHDVWCVFQVLKCVLVNHTGSHNKIHHTEEDSGKLLVYLNL